MIRPACAGRYRRPRRLSGFALGAAVLAPLTGLMLVATGLMTTAWAASPSRPLMVEIGDRGVRTVRVVQGRSQNLRTSRGFVDLVVGDPAIADVMPLSDRTLYVLGKTAGITNVSIFDAEKQLVGVIEVEVGPDTARMGADIARADPGAQARVTTSNGRTLLSGEAPDGVAAGNAAAIARNYGSDVVNTMRVRQPQQVMLEVRFVEASRNSSKELGVSWNVNGQNFGSPNSSRLNLQAITGFAGLASGNTPFGSFIGRVLSGGVEADVLIQALEERGLARRLAEPNLVAMSGEKASFLAGGEFPIPVAGDFNRVTIEYKKFGVGLTFVPTVLSGGVINLKIEPEVSQLDTTTVIRTAGVTVPSIIVRRATTTVELRDGQSFAIAGLLQSINTQTQSQLPWLGDVPVLGALFRSAAFERRETDLAIIVTPRLVRPSKPGERLLTPFDASRPGSDADLFLAGRQEIPVAEARGPLAPAVGHILDLPQGGRRAVN
jgi:pilus assembly protein CpaC